VLALRAGAVKSLDGNISIGGQVVASSRQVPAIVGLSLQAGVLIPTFVGKVLRRFQKLKSFVRTHHPSYLLAIRAVMAYAVSVLDYGARGSYLPFSSIKVLQPPVNKLA
jgi:hypothetical protein